MAFPLLLLLGQAGLGAYAAEQQRKAGSQAKDQLFEQADEIRMQAEDITQTAIEQQESVDIGTREDVARGETRAAKSGVRVAGSVTDASAKRRGQGARQKELIRSRASGAVARFNRQSERLRSRGLEAKEAGRQAAKLGYISTGLSLGAGGYKIGTRGGKQQFDWNRIFS